MTIGSVLGEAWGLYTKFFVRFVVLALVVFGAIDAVFALFAAAMGHDNRGAATLVGSTAAQALVAPFAAIAVTLIYFQVAGAPAGPSGQARL